MARKGSAGRQSATLADWLRLQQLLVDRTSQYVETIGQLTAEGSFEPREYVERSTKFWADMIGDVGDWLQPPAAKQRGRSEAEVPRHRAKVQGRLLSRPFPIAIPFTLFGSLDAGRSFRLSIDGFARRLKPGASRRPPLMLEPQKHFSLTPEVVTRSGRRRVELKVHNLPDNLASGDVYEGGLWAAPLTEDAGGKRTLIAVMELEIA